jgi:hypothetical protein
MSDTRYEIRDSRSGIAPNAETRLPEFESTEEAIRFGQFITRDQFIYLCGARAAMRQVFDELRTYHGESSANMQLRADLACRMQLIREALDEVPPAVRASIVGLGLEGN